MTRSAVSIVALSLLACDGGEPGVTIRVLEGVQALYPDGDWCAVRATAEQMAELTSSSVVEPVDRDLFLVHGPVDGLAELTRLPVFIADTGLGPLIADEKIRARFVADWRPTAVESLAIAFGARSVRLVRAEQNIYEVTAPDPASTLSLAQRLDSHPATVWAHPDLYQPLADAQQANDALFPGQWHHDIIDSARAWRVGRGASDVTLAIIDEGMDLTHPDLAAKVVAPFDTLDNDPDPAADEIAPHGTAVAGLAAAVTDNGIGIAGACPDCSLMPIRVQSGGMTRMGAVSDAFYWAVDNGAWVISASWTATMSPSLRAAIDYASRDAFGGLGTVVVFSAGNDGDAIPSTSTAAHPDVLTVGATDALDARADYSSFGPELDIVAPAASVTTDLQGAWGYSPGDYTDTFGGTSAATPLVAGVAGILLDIDSTLHQYQVHTILRAAAAWVAAESPGPEGRDDDYGHGRLDAGAAVDMLITGFGRPCERDAQCGPGATCQRMADGSASCALVCESDQGCPARMDCREDLGICLPYCTADTDCAAGDCWPTTDGSGHCLPGAPCLGPQCDDEDDGQSTVAPAALVAAEQPEDVVWIGMTSCRAAPAPLWLTLVGLLARRRPRRR